MGSQDFPQLPVRYLNKSERPANSSPNMIMMVNHQYGYVRLPAAAVPAYPELHSRRKQRIVEHSNDFNIPAIACKNPLR
ncbi:hypothetical protein A8B75_14745 [Sphingomonadales bacterium EhC05]|nr:hypothetical protein A8B75_14745 [Sphingomonadales bacterium EhC05]